MRRKRKRATSVVVDGVVHAIGEHAHDEPWGAWGAFPLPRRMTRAQRKAEKARLFKERIDPLVRLACEPRYPWRFAPRTHAAVSCITCLVVAARAGC